MVPIRRRSRKDWQDGFLVSTVPADEATEVSKDAAIVVTFDFDVASGTVSDETIFIEQEE